jgi:uncharacterized protein YkwD
MRGRRAFEPVQKVDAGGIVRRKPRSGQSCNDKRCEQYHAHNGKGLSANAVAEGMKKSHRLDKEYSDTRDQVGSNEEMTYLRHYFYVVALLVFAGVSQVTAQRSPGRLATDAAEQLFAMGNHARAQAGAAPLAWDTALAAAARKHCERMVAEGAISHQYRGEADLSGRASLAGAHFGLIEENIAVGSYPAEIHEGWMNSPGHRKNLLNPDVDHVGIAVITRGREMYAVVDFERAVPVLSSAQVEARVARLLRMSGIGVRGDAAYARAACVLDSGFPRVTGGDQPQFVMRWQGADLEHLPQQLADRLGSGRYRKADVGSCQPRGNQPAFTQYRIAVLLY